MENLNKKYIQATKNRGPIILLKEIIETGNIQEGAKALDLGCGAGVNARYLAQRKIVVEAVDFNQESIDQSRKTCKNLSVKIVKKNILDYDIAREKYSVIVFWYVLPFLEREKSLKLFERIREGLTPQGFLIFGFFGPEDAWSKIGKVSSWEIEEFKEKFPGLDFIKIIEVKEKRNTISGHNKFWHKIYGIAQKK